MKALLTLVRCDLRTHLWWLVLLAGLQATQLVLVIGLAPKIEYFINIPDLLNGLIVIVGYLFVLEVCTEDSPVSSRAHWATRPIAPAFRWCSKLLVMLVGLLGWPLVFATVFWLEQHLGRARAWDAFVVLIQFARLSLSVGFFAYLFFPLGTTRRERVSRGLAGGLCVILLAILAAIIDLGRRDDSSSSLLAASGFTAFGLLIGWVLEHHLRRRGPALMVVAVSALAFGVLHVTLFQRSAPPLALEGVHVRQGNKGELLLEFSNPAQVPALVSGEVSGTWEAGGQVQRVHGVLALEEHAEASEAVASSGVLQVPLAARPKGLLKMDRDDLVGVERVGASGTLKLRVELVRHDIVHTRSTPLPVEPVRVLLHPREDLRVLPVWHPGMRTTGMITVDRGWSAYEHAGYKPLLLEGETGSVLPARGQVRMTTTVFGVPCEFTHDLFAPALKTFLTKGLVLQEREDRVVELGCFSIKGSFAVEAAQKRGAL